MLHLVTEAEAACKAATLPGTGLTEVCELVRLPGAKDSVAYAAAVAEPSMPHRSVPGVDAAAPRVVAAARPQRRAGDGRGVGPPAA